MLVHYLREHNEIVEKDGRKFIRSHGPKRGVLISTGRNRVGWSLYNKKAEDEEIQDEAFDFWIQHGMSYENAEHKASKLSSRFDKKKAIHYAKQREETSTSLYVKLIEDEDSIPHSIKKFIPVMVERSRNYYKD